MEQRSQRRAEPSLEAQAHLVEFGVLKSLLLDESLNKTWSLVFLLRAELASASARRLGSLESHRRELVIVLELEKLVA